MSSAGCWAPTLSSWTWWTIRSERCARAVDPLCPLRAVLLLSVVAVVGGRFVASSPLRLHVRSEPPLLAAVMASVEGVWSGGLVELVVIEHRGPRAVMWAVARLLLRSPFKLPAPPVQRAFHLATPS